MNMAPWESSADTVRLITLRMEPRVIEHWTPFNELSPGEAASPGYRHALTRQHTLPDLPYGLDLWHAGTKVLSVFWEATELPRWATSFAAPGRMKCWRWDGAAASPPLVNWWMRVAPGASGPGL